MDHESDSVINDDTYINPVCGVSVSKKDAKHVLEYGVHTVYFCCDGCKASSTLAKKYIEVLERCQNHLIISSSKNNE